MRILIAGALAALPVIVAAQAVVVPPDVTVGVVRSDGFLQPFAALRAGVWRALVQDPGDGRNRIVLTQEGRALPRQGWTLFARDGSASPLGVQDLAMTGSHCTDVEGFATDAPRRPVRDSWPRPKIGVALAGTAQLTRAEDVTAQPDAASRRAAAMIVQLVQALEADAIRGGKGGSLRTLAPSVRVARAVRLTTLARGSWNRGLQYYFEARKQYREVRTDFFVSGWLNHGEYQSGVVKANAQVTDGDYKGVTTSEVLGILQLGDRAVWVLDDHHYEGESYSLFEWGARVGPALSVYGGGC